MYNVLCTLSKSEHLFSPAKARRVPCSTGGAGLHSKRGAQGGTKYSNGPGHVVLRRHEEHVGDAERAEESAGEEGVLDCGGGFAFNNNGIAVHTTGVRLQTFNSREQG